MRNIRRIELPAQEHLQRQTIYQDSTRQLIESFKGKLSGHIPRYDPKNFPLIEFVKGNEHFEIPLASDPRWAQKRFGAVGTIQSSGCLPLALCTMLRLMGEKAEVTDLVNEVVNKGFRFWSFGNYPKVTLNWPDCRNLNRIKEQFLDLCHVTDIEEALRILGPIHGIGGHAYAIDEFIAAYTGQKAYEDTKVYSWEQVVANLENKCSVPIRFDRRLLTQQTPSEGHYGVLIGLRGHNAVIIDSSAPGGILEVPIEKFIVSVISDGRATAWNTMPSKH